MIATSTNNNNNFFALGHTCKLLLHFVDISAFPECVVKTTLAHSGCRRGGTCRPPPLCHKW